MDLGLDDTVGLDASVATDVGRVRSMNQDRALIGRVRLAQDWYAVGLVADGMGGGSRGEEASRIAAETFMQSLASAESSDPRDVIVHGVGAAHAAVVRAADDLGISGETFATTLVCALVEEATGHATIANVGDSRACVVSATGVQRVTRDHSIVAERLAAGRISEQEAREAYDRGVLTRAVGAQGTLRVDVFGPQPLRPGDMLVLCSDGLYGMLDDEQIRRVVASNSPLEMASALVEAANDQGGEDNVSAVVVAAPGVGPRVRPGAVDRLLGRLPRRRMPVGWPMATLVPDAAGGPDG